MNPLQQHLQRINEKLQLLLKQYRAVQKENEKLKSALADSKKEQADNLRQIEALEQKVAVLKTATNNLDEDDKKELEKRINTYLKEIDRCIAVLGE